jgi:TP901 family phage tail tape measure protein
MADVNANIGVGIDTSDALNQLKNLQRQISQFHSSVAKSSESAAIAQRDLQKNFLNSVNAIQGFSAELKTVRTTAESFTNSLEKNKFSIREYFRYAAGASGKFSNNFAAEFSTIEKVAVERVKTLQTQYIKMGRDAQGAMQAIAIRPTTLNMQDLGTQVAITAQKQVIFNQLLKQGSTNLLNFGKNTQWAGRQLMVGFTLPLATLGMTAGRVFMDMEKAALKFRKVYGDLFTPTEERDQALADIVELGKEYTAYGIAVSDAVDIAGEAAAAGFAGVDLQNQTAAALKLSVLGQLDLNQALETTIALQNAFQISSANLAGEINFLNAVENQTVVSLDDITTAIPKVAPVIQQLGGDVRDLAFFMAAMKEGGINASEGANALKSGLASLINPSTQAAEMLNGFGINLRGIVELNKGDISGTVLDFAKALDSLDPLNRARAIEQLFGKFQFARISALFDNVIRDGSQASRVLELAGSSVEELAALSEGELGISAASSMNKFLKAVEQIKLALAPIGEQFLQVATPIIEFGTKMLEAFNNLPDGIKKSITTVITVIGGIGPIALMTFGLINNGIANMIKFFATVRLGYLKITGQAQGVGDETQYMTTEQLEAASAAASLDQAHSNLTQRFTAEKVAVDALRTAYEQAAAAGARFAMLNPGMMKPGAPKKFGMGGKVKKYALGGFVGGSGNGDTVPAMLTPGEFVIKKKEAQIFLPLLQAINEGKVPGFNQGGMVGKGFSNATMFLPESINTLMGGAGLGAPTGDVTAYLKKAADAAAAPLMAVMAREIGLKLNDPKLMEEWKVVGSSLIQSATDALEKSGKTFVNDDDFEELVVPAMKENIKTLNVAGKELSTALNKAFDEIRTVAPLGSKSGAMGGTGRVSLPGSYRGARVPAQTFAMASNPEMFQQTQRFSQSRGKIVNSFQTQNVATGESEVATMAHLKRSITTTVDNLILKVAPYLGDQTARIVKAVSKGTVDGIKKSTDQASPSKEAYNAGANIGKGAVQGIASQTDEALDAGKKVGASVVSGATQQTATASAAPRRASTVGNLTFDTQSSKFRDQAQTARLLEGRQKGLARATQMAMANVSNFATKMSGATFALSSVAGIASMFGGKVGEAAGAIMQITSLMFALSTVTMGLIRAKTAETTASMIASLNVGRTAGGVMGPGGGWLGGAKGMAGIKNLFGNVGKVAKEFLPILGKIPKGAGKATLALIALAGVFSVGKVLFENLMKPFRLLGETANLSSDKLKTLGELLNVQVRQADFSGKFAGTTAKTTEQRAQVDILLESEDFKAEFADQIQAIKGATKENAERTLNALALQLSASGFDAAAVEAIMNAIVIEAGKKDLDLKFASIDFKSADGLASIERLAKESALKLNQSFLSQDVGDALLGWAGGGQLQGQIKTTAGEFASLFQALQVGFATGEITAEEFNSQLAALELQLSSIDPAIAGEALSQMIEKLGMGDQVKNVKNFKDQLLLVKAAAAGIEIPAEAVKILEEAGKAGADPKIIADATRLREQFNQMIRDTALATEEANNAQQQQQIADASIQEAIDAMIAEEQQLQNMASAHKTLVDLGYDEATAYTIASNAMYASAIAAAVASDAIGTTTGKLAEVLGYMNAMLEAQNKAPIAVTSGGGGGSQKSDFQEAMEQLGKQRKEIQNTIKAYGGLRQAGFSATEALLVANDAVLAAALASKKVGSKEWKNLVNQIKLARIEALNTAEGLRDAFGGLKSLADEYFSILERQTDRKYEDSIKGQEKAIEAYGDAIASVNEEIEGHQQALEDLQRSMTVQFDRPIEVLQEESSDLSNDLTLMDRAADNITKRYEEQSKALSQVAKVNQQIIGQQKSQMSLADALASGDIGAAASIMQDMRAAEADAAATTQEEMLNAARDSEIAGLRSAGGMSRLDIEERQFEISQQIFQLEERREKAALAARDIEDTIYNIQKNKLDPLTKQQTAAEKALKTTNDQKKAELEAIDAQRQRWTDAQLALDTARLEAGEFAEVIDMTAGLTGDVVKDWKTLESKAITLTINTVRKSLGEAPTDAAPTEASGGGGGGSQKTVIPIIDPGKTAAAAAEAAEAVDPFAWLKNIDVGGMVNEFFGQPWMRSLGAIFVGSFQLFDEFVIQPIRGWFDSIGSWIDRTLGKPIRDTLKTWSDEFHNFTAPAREWFDGISSWIDDKFGKPIRDTIDSLTKAFDEKFIQPIKNLWNGFTSWWNEDTSMTQKIEEFKNTFKRIITHDLPGMWSSFTSGLTSGWNSFVSGLGAGFRSIMNAIIDKLNQIGNVTLPTKIGLIPLPPGIAGAQLKLWNFQKLNKGGMVNGSGPDKDSVPTMLTPGEFVINRSATKKFGPALSAINSGSIGNDLIKSRYSLPEIQYAPRDFDSPVYSMPDRSVPKSQDVSSVYGENSQASLSQVDNSVYNYNLSVNVEGSSSNAEQIANVVIGKLRNIQSQQVRGQVIR